MKLNQKVKDVLIWVSSFLGAYSLACVVTYVLVGGYFHIKDQSAETKKTLRNSLIVLLVFIGISMVLAFFNYFLALCEVSTVVISKISLVVEIVKIVSYIAIIGVAIFRQDTVIESSDDDTAEQEVIIE